MDKEEIIDEYVRRCSNVCKKRGYYGLSEVKEGIRRIILDKFKNPGERKVSRIVKICEEQLFSYLEGVGAYSWSLVNEEELKDRINKALQ